MLGLLQFQEHKVNLSIPEYLVHMAMIQVAWRNSWCHFLHGPNINIRMSLSSTLLFNDTHVVFIDYEEMVTLTSSRGKTNIILLLVVRFL